MNLNANYYDHPEGEDAVGKMVATNKYALAAGVAWSTVEVLMVSNPKGYLPVLARYAYFTGPFMGMASAFTMGTFAMTNLRKKDDRINYIFGGLCAGAVFGSWRRSVIAGVQAGLIFAIAATVKKISKQEGWEFFPEMPTHEVGTLRGVKHDFTIMHNPPKGWTNGKE